MKVKSPAFQFYVRDWLCSASVARMTGDQVKAYINLLCAAWLEDECATLPNDDIALAALARVDTYTWNQIKEPVLAKFSLLPSGRLYNDRQMAELEKQISYREAALQREESKRRNQAQFVHNKTTIKPQQDHNKTTKQPLAQKMKKK